MPILRRPCPRLPLRASLWMKILIESLISSAHLFGGRPRGRSDPLGSHSDTIFAHLSYFMRDTCPAHFKFLRKTCFSSYGVESSPSRANPSSDFFSERSIVRKLSSEVFDLLGDFNPRVQNIDV
uniref:Uncharacterized protein n=1 Tax=Caenorhabditis japonica TaxID=281687 RepID=A0A8R1IGZ1_CAEJA